MKIQNHLHFLLVILLLATGTTSAVAHEVSQCESVEPLRPGDAVTDTVSDVPAAHTDITAVETSLSGENLTVVFHLKDLPDTLRFNRTEHGEGSMEYMWEVAIDVDNDRSTGPGGFDMLLSAYHIAFMSHKGTEADTTAPLGDMLEAAVWEINPGGSTSPLTDAVLAVSAGEDTITITGFIPGITFESRLTFSTYDFLFAGEADQIDCHAPYRESVGTLGVRRRRGSDGPGANRIGRERERCRSAYRYNQGERLFVGPDADGCLPSQGRAGDAHIQSYRHIRKLLGVCMGRAHRRRQRPGDRVRRF